MFADDLKNFHTVKNLQYVSLIQRDWDTFKQYCRQTGLYLNLQMCHPMSFTKNLDSYFVLHN